MDILVMPLLGLLAEPALPSLPRFAQHSPFDDCKSGLAQWSLRRGPAIILSSNFEHVRNSLRDISAISKANAFKQLSNSCGLGGVMQPCAMQGTQLDAD